MIDLRSDTVTRPTPGMREAMLRAEVGDDVFGEDPTVNALEERVAALFGHEAALFCASGTMANQIAIKVHTRPGDEVIGDEGMHLYRYEGGGLMAISGCSVKLIHGDHGRFTAGHVEAAINDPTNIHLARPRVVSIENTSNRGGGSIWDHAEVARIRALCDARSLVLHLDGARIFNAMAVDGSTPAHWGRLAHSISICLSKGLGAPVGSMLTGDTAFISEARRVRKRLGGGMRQAGMLAAAGLYALDHHVERLRDDHRRAQRLAQALSGHPMVESLLPVRTNIVVCRLHGNVDGFLAKLRDQDIHAVAFGPGMVRMVTHLDVDDAAIDRTITAIGTLRA